jgi:hypothetical protein
MTMACGVISPRAPCLREALGPTYQFTFIIRLVVLGDLWDDNIRAVVKQASCRLEENEREWWWTSSRLLN